MTGDEFLTYISDGMNRAFAFAPVLEGVVLLVVLLGLADTLMVSVLGRTREIGVLRAVGARRRDVLWMIVLEGLVVAGVGGAIGILGGSALGVVWMHVRFKYLFGWILDVYFPVRALLSGVVLVLIVTLLASAYPGYRASRQSVVRSIAYE